MTFGEKIKRLRLEKNLSQQDLANLIGKSSRTVTAYEIGASHPRTRALYHKLAEVLEVNVNYLLTDGEDFMMEVGEQFGRRGQMQAAAILHQTKELFAGGTLSETDQLAFLTEMQEIFLDAKRSAQKKYTPKKYRAHSEREAAVSANDAVGRSEDGDEA